MQSLRDLVQGLRTRKGVAAVVVFGRDGLVIESDTNAPVSPEALAAHTPNMMASALELGRAGGVGAPQSAVLLHERGICIASHLGNDLHIVVVTDRSAPFGDILFELSRDREQIGRLA